MEEQKMQLVEWFDDLCVRFIINLPQEELEQVERICFQIEEAQWFYEDFVRPLDPNLPSLPLRPFALQMFKHCPLFSQFDERQHIQAFDQWLAYKTSVPVRGAIMLNEDMDHVVLVKGWKKGSNWSFPRGKINKDETDLDCAVRETYEETGYDLRQAGLIPDDNSVKAIEITMRSQHMKLFVFRGVPMDTVFETRTRKEISKIQWYKLSSLPGWKKKKQNSQTQDEGVLGVNKVYVVAPFLPQLKGWITQQRKNDKAVGGKDRNGVTKNANGRRDHDEYITDERDAQDVSDGAMVGATPHVSVSHPLDIAKQSNATMHENADGGDLMRLLRRPPDERQAPPAPPPQETTHQARPDGASLLALLQGRSPVENASSGPQTRDPAPSDFNDPRAAYSANSHYNDWQRQMDEVASMQSRVQPQAAAQRYHSGRNVFAPSVTNGPGYQAPRNPLDTRHEQSDLDRTASLLRLFGRQSSQVEPQNRQPGLRPDQSQGHNRASSQRQEQPPQSGPVAPAASQLPAPKLNAHSQSLLDVFKTERNAPATQAPQSHPRSTIPPTKIAHNSPTVAVPPARTPTIVDSHSREAMLQSEHQQHTRRESQSARASPARRSPNNISHNGQQNALLDLFRKPSASASPIPQQSDAQHKSVAQILQQPLPNPETLQNRGTASQAPAEVKHHDVQPKELPIASQTARPASPPKTPKWSSLFAPPAAELAASPSPVPQKKQIFDHKEGKMRDHIPSPRVLARPTSSGRGSQRPHGSLTSATVTGPVPEPDFGSMRRKNKPPNKKAEQPMAPRHDTVKILKRPETPKEASPPKPAAQPVPTLVPTTPRLPASRKPTPSPRAPRSPGSTGGKAEAKKPFTPQILRRPQPPEPETEPSKGTADQSQAVMSEMPLKAETTLPPAVLSPSDQTERLLSIFQKPAETASPAVEIPTHAPASSSPAQVPPPESHIVSPAPAPALVDSRIASPAALPAAEPRIVSPAAAPDQKQTLLSLFAKPSAPASAAPSPAHTGLGIQQKAGTAQQASTPLMRSRFNSLASRDTGSPSASPSTSGMLRSESNVGNASRRGSQTPISPNDKSFLLSYLTSFTKGTTKK